MTPPTTAAEPAPPLVQTSDAPAHGTRGPALVTAAVMLLAVLVGIQGSRPPRPVPESAPPAAFSAERARTQLREITRAPHPVGSAEHGRVRARLESELRGLGLEVQTQTTTSLRETQPGARVAGTVHNVVGRLRGTGSTGAVLLMAHYDAVPHSFGAADDGAGVVAILETLRALRAGPPLRNDVMVLFSDAEEVGLLGAAAFEEQHPWARDVGIVLNFEGRGSTGPVLMFQTSPGNGRLVATAAGAVRDAAGNSLMVDVYRRLPNDTDLTIFLRAGRPVPALNFSFVGGHTHYHTPLDRFEEMNPATLQHHGEYALGLARAFGGADLLRLAGPDHVYFDLPVIGLVHYPFGWALPLGVLAVLAAAGAVVVAARRRTITAGGIALGVAFPLVGLVLAAVVSIAGWMLATAVRPGLRSILQGDAYNADAWLVAFTALTAGVVLGLYAWLRRRTAPGGLAAGALLLWAVLALATAVTMPGGSYLFTWPVLFAAASFAVMTGTREMGMGRAAALALLAVPALVLFAPFVRMFETALGFGMLAAPMGMMALLLALLAPQLEVLARPRGRTPALTLLAAGIVALIAAAATTRFDAEDPQPNSIAYLLDADSGRAYWASSDAAPDAWTRQFLGDAPARRSLATAGGGALGAAPLVAEAPALTLAPPQVTLLSDSAVEGGRRIRLRITSPRGAERLGLNVEDAVPVGEVEVNGHAPARPGPFTGGAGQRVVNYHAVPPEGIEVAFTVRSTEPITLRVTDTWYGLPAVPGGITPRPEGMMSKPFILTDVTMASRTLRI